MRIFFPAPSFPASVPGKTQMSPVELFRASRSGRPSPVRSPGEVRTLYASQPPPSEVRVLVLAGGCPQTPS
ncbi:hypothetical protein ACW23B_16085 [Streptomyces albidoflavus]